MYVQPEIQNRLDILFKDFTYADPISENLIDDKSYISISHEDFPVEAILLFTLHKICKFSSIYRWDKMHWGIVFKYKGIVNMISSHKFGLRIYSQKLNGSTNHKEIINRLKKNIKFIETKILAQYAEKQINSSNFTIQNNFHKLDNQYMYFRYEAQKLFAKEITREDKDFTKVLSNYLRKKDWEIEAVYNALSMIDSYFSRLEHILVLILPFAKKDSKYEIKKTIGQFWSEKYIEVLGCKGLSKKIYDNLIQIKEKYRNTFAHGGFEKKSQSFHFHLEGYGAVPATMSDYKNSVHFTSTPLNEDKFIEIVKIFDELDRYIEENLVAGWKFCQSGLDLIMDRSSLKNMLKVSQDPDNFEHWLQNENERLCNYINADY